MATPATSSASFSWQVAIGSAINLAGYALQIGVLKLFILRYDFPHPLFLTFLDQLVAFFAILFVTHVVKIMPDPRVVPRFVADVKERLKKTNRRLDFTDTAGAADQDEVLSALVNKGEAAGQSAVKNKTNQGESLGTTIIPTYNFKTQILPLGLLNIISGATHYSAHEFLFPSFVEMMMMTQTVPQVLLSKFLSRDISTLTLISVIPITFGSVLCAFGEVNYSVSGIALVLGAMLSGVFRRAVAEGVMKSGQQAAGPRGIRTTSSSTPGIVPKTDGSINAGINNYSELQKNSSYGAAPAGASTSGLQEPPKPVGLNPSRKNDPTLSEKMMVSWGMAYRLTPINVVGLLLLSLFVEGSEPWTEVHGKIIVSTKFHSIYFGLMLLVFKGLGTTVWYISEFTLVHFAGAFYMAVLNNISRVGVIFTTLAVFGNSVSSLQGCGFALTLLGVGVYLYDFGFGKNRSTTPASADVPASVTALSDDAYKERAVKQ
ncbi:unnamed protein product [Amoebophrya sp. A120]|nr:unnamed protein product [Amoebophrya sp. A120]|eukprot:GSA120T00016124001.1